MMRIKATDQSPFVLLDAEGGIFVVRGSLRVGYLHDLFDRMIAELDTLVQRKDRRVISAFFDVDNLPSATMPHLRDLLDRLTQFCANEGSVQLVWMCPSDDRLLRSMIEHIKDLYETGRFQLYVESYDSTEGYERINEQQKKPLIFVSYPSEQADFAKDVVNCLDTKMLDYFFAYESVAASGNADFSKVIDEALASCKHMLLVLADPSLASKRWLESEWRFFLNEKRAGNKDGNIVCIIKDKADRARLPAPLRHYQCVEHSVHLWSDLKPFVSGA